MREIYVNTKLLIDNQPFGNVTSEFVIGAGGGGFSHTDVTYEDGGAEGVAGGAGAIAGGHAATSGRPHGNRVKHVGGHGRRTPSHHGHDEHEHRALPQRRHVIHLRQVSAPVRHPAVSAPPPITTKAPLEMGPQQEGKHDLSPSQAGALNVRNQAAKHLEGIQGLHGRQTQGAPGSGGGRGVFSGHPIPPGQHGQPEQPVTDAVQVHSEGRQNLMARGEPATQKKWAAGPDPVVMKELNRVSADDPEVHRKLLSIYAGESAHKQGHYDTGDFKDKDPNKPTSFGPLQFHRGGPGSIGTDFERTTGKSLEDPKTMPAQFDYAAHWLKEHPAADPGKTWFGYRDRGKRMVDEGWGADPQAVARREKFLPGDPGAPGAIARLPSMPHHTALPDNAKALVESEATQLGKHAANVREYLQKGGVNLNPTQAAWCAAFVDSTLRQHGFQRLSEDVNRNVATNYAQLGTPVTGQVRAGDIGVLMRGHGVGSTGGHVTMLTGREKDGKVETIEGNVGGTKGNRVVGKKWEPRNKMVIRRPEEEGDKPTEIAEK